MAHVAAVGCGAESTSAERDDDDGERRRPRANKRSKGKRSSLPLGSTIHIARVSDDGEAYRVDHDAVMQVLSLAAMGTFPVTAVDNGYRVDTVETESVFELAGLHKGDVVTHVNGVGILESDVLRKAYLMTKTARTIALTVRRKGQTVPMVYKISRSLRPRKPPRSTSASPSSSRSKVAPPEIAAGIEKVSPNHYRISRKVLRSVSSSPDASRWARVIPHTEDGKAMGLKLYGIRRASLPGLLGFQNGDRLETVNGISVATPDAYTALSKNDKIVVVITRRGKKVRLEYTVVDP